MQELKLPYTIRELDGEIRKEFERVRTRLRERNRKIIAGKEYELSKDCYYRGTLMGSVVESIYMLSPSVLVNSKYGIRIFVDKTPEAPINYANYYASSESTLRDFEEKQRKKGFNIPSGGAVLLEIPKNRVRKSKKILEKWQYGILLEGPIHVSVLTENCKEYILRELGAGKISFAYEILFEKIK